MTQPVILLGLGFTTRRLARRLLFRGSPVFAAVRDPDRFRDLSAIGLRLAPLESDVGQLGKLRTDWQSVPSSSPGPDGGGSQPPRRMPSCPTIVHTVPPLPSAENHTLRELIARLEPRRVVYISSTSVYGNASQVNETTPAQPCEDKGRNRIHEESWLKAGPWETLIVRPAAIYGPGRGVHVRIRENRPPRGEPSGVTSRIHVDDLAAILESGTLSNLTGAWPLADDYPCPTSEIAVWCGRAFRKELAAEWFDKASGTGRSVDGRTLRELLDTELRYPEYQSGILASLAEERREFIRRVVQF